MISYKGVFYLRFRLLALMLVLMFVLSACGNGKPNDLDWEVQNFSFIDQNNEQLSLEDLNGEVWIADFIFTNCTTVCQPMTLNMSEVQKRLEEAGIDAKIVSFSVDPTHDTPEVLENFASKFTDDLSNWHLLSGYTQDKIEEFAKQSFKASATPIPDTDQFLHHTSFYLVDQNGIVVKTYDGVNPDFDEIIKDMKALAS